MQILQQEEDVSGIRLKKVFMILIILAILSGITDLLFDYQESEWSWHETIEAFMLLTLLCLLVLLWWEASRALQLSNHENSILRQQMHAFQRRHASAMSQMRAAIEEQFMRWRFTAAETRVARLIMHGLSHRQIAGLLDRSEKTIRNTALTIYQEAGMSGRADLAAFFLSDFLSDPEETA